MYMYVCMCMYICMYVYVRTCMYVCVCTYITLFSGQPKQFTLQFKLSENYPLDVYFLLDVTGSFANNFKQTVIPLATDLGTVCVVD